MKALDLRGQRFGRLLAVDRVESGGGQARWLCRCDCGVSHITTAGNLRGGHTTSCGCQSSRATIAARSTKHGHATRGRKSTEYRTWGAMIERCHRPLYKDFQNYGGRGVKVCDRWRYGEDGKTGFECFYDDMGPRPGGLSLDRIEVNDDYRPGNCRWATASIQAQNRRYSSVRKLTATHVSRIRAIGRGLSSREIAQRFGVTYGHVNGILAGRTWHEAPERQKGGDNV
jgi:hypothetical protein